MARYSLLVSVLFLLPVQSRAVPSIMLDPGHGGTNTGAFGPDAQIYEKTLTLALSQSTMNYLYQWLPGVTVALTRSSDEYLTLQDRVQRAQAAHVDLFMSVHCNASESKGQQGFETFILSREASDQESAHMASQENKDQSRSDGNSRKPSVVKHILLDLKYTAAHAASLELARLIQKKLAQVRGANFDRGVRQAPFDVLLGLPMPGVLVEVGFIDHPVEGPTLSALITRERIALALAAAISEFLTNQGSTRVRQ